LRGEPHVAISTSEIELDSFIRTIRDTIPDRVYFEGETSMLIYIIAESENVARELARKHGPQPTGVPTTGVPITPEEDREMYSNYVAHLESNGQDRFDNGGYSYLEYMREYYGVTVAEESRLFVKGVNPDRKWDSLDSAYELFQKGGISLGFNSGRDTANPSSLPLRHSQVASIDWKNTQIPDVILTRGGDWLAGSGEEGWAEKVIEYMYDLGPHTSIYSMRSRQ
jgi:hypothetical protein